MLFVNLLAVAKIQIIGCFDDEIFAENDWLSSEKISK